MLGRRNIGGLQLKPEATNYFLPQYESDIFGKSNVCWLFIANKSRRKSWIFSSSVPVF